MPNFLQISLTNECNFSCWHCPMKEWRNSGRPKFPLKNSELLPFLEKFVDPKRWIVELTGGEPTLYEGFDELLEWLSGKGYYTLVKTNGSNTIKKYGNVKVCSAFHRLNEPPAYFDEILIVDRIKREEKEAFCKEHGIPYKVIGYGKENPDGAAHGFKLCAFINPAGHNTHCQAERPIEDYSVDPLDDYGRITHRPFFCGPCCERCKAAIDAWRFMPEELKRQE